MKTESLESIGLRDGEVQRKLQVLTEFVDRQLAAEPLKEEKSEPVVLPQPELTVRVSSPKLEALPALLPQQCEDLPALVPKKEGISTTDMPQPNVMPLNPVPVAMDIAPEFKQMRLVLTPISANTRSKRLQQKTPKNVGLTTNATESIKIAHKKAKKSQAKRFRSNNVENIRPKSPEPLVLPMLNVPIGLNRPLPNDDVHSEGSSDEELANLTTKGLEGPEVHYSLTLSQISEVLCVAKAVTLDRVDSFVSFQEMDKEACIEMTHTTFDKLMDTAEVVNSILAIIKGGASVKSQIYLGDDIFLTVKSKYPATPVDIRKFRETENGDRIFPTRVGQCLTASEWAVFYSLREVIHQRLLEAEKDVKKVLNHMKARIQNRQNNAQQ